MELHRPPRRRPAESVVPMINVVFLLLIFFLMTAMTAPDDPFGVAPPEGVSDAVPPGKDRLFMAADGRLAFGAARGEAVFPALAARATDGALDLTADTAVPVADLARLLQQLEAAGIGTVHLAVDRP